MLKAITHAHRRDQRAVLASVAAALALTLGAAAASAQSAPLQVNVSESTTVELDGNSTTGYRWELDDGASESGDLVKVEDLGYVKRELKPGERPLMGAPSKYQFRVTGLEAGNVKLVFTYVKGHETPPAKTQDVTIEVVGD
jgi:predicted secreted protein